MTFIEPITITNILQKSAQELAAFINMSVLVNKVPLYHPNHPLSIVEDILPRLGKYSNDRSYVTELYNVIIAEYFSQKGLKKDKDNRFDDTIYLSLEAKKEILYRTMQALESMYEATSRIMTGIGTPDNHWSRVP